MSELKIEKNVPMPGRRGGAAPIWPWPILEVGESVFVPAKRGETGTTIRKRVNPYPYAQRAGKKFALRSMKHEGSFGVRVWRTE